MSNTSTETTINYEVWFGPEEMKNREVRSFKGINPRQAAQALKEAQDFFNLKEKTMNASVFKIEETITTTRSKIT